MKIIRINSPVSDQKRAEILFTGDVLIQSNISAAHQLIDWTTSLLSAALAPLEITTAQAHLSPKAFIDLTTAVQSNFHNSEYAKALFFAALTECGVDPSHTYYDHFPLRIVPYGTTHGGARNAFISPHRDTWGSNIHSQINWWAPIFELEATRTIAIYPKYWAEPIPNNTATWRFAKHMESRRNTPAGLNPDYPSAPSPLATVDETDGIKVLLQPGEILSFSSAHLHGSVPNTSMQTRYSVEMRTINQLDLSTGRQAPNIDNAATERMYRWFKRITDKQALRGCN